MDLTSSSVVNERHHGSFAIRQKNGNTNGLSRQVHKARTKLQQRNSVSATILLLGAVMYGAALIWPLAAMSPSWASYPLAIVGVSLLLLSLRNMWERTTRWGHRA